MAVIPFGVVLLMNVRQNERTAHKILGAIYQAEKGYHYRSRGQRVI